MLCGVRGELGTALSEPRPSCRSRRPECLQRRGFQLGEGKVFPRSARRGGRAVECGGLENRDTSDIGFRIVSVLSPFYLLIVAIRGFREKKRPLSVSYSLGSSRCQDIARISTREEPDPFLVSRTYLRPCDKYPLLPDRDKQRALLEAVAT